MQLSGLVVNLNDNRMNFAINGHHFIYFHKCNKYKFMFGKFHCVFLEIYFLLIGIDCEICIPQEGERGTSQFRNGKLNYSKVKIISFLCKF